MKIFQKFFKLQNYIHYYIIKMVIKMSEPIRILNLFTIMNRGGAETMVMNYYRKIDKSKIQFDFLVHRNQKGAYDDEIEAMGGRIYRMCPIYPQNFKKYKKMLQDFFNEHNEYKIIHSHMSELGYFAFKEADKRGINAKICHAHNAPHAKNESLSEKIKHIMRDYFKLRIRKYTDYMFVCSQEAGNWLFSEKNKDKFIMMNNAVDAEKFSYSKSHRNQIRQELNLKDEFVILNVGRFNLQKNHSFLIDIFNEIQIKHPNSKLLLAGNGELENEIQQKVKKLNLQNKVMFLGLRDDVHKILSASDVFLFPSLYEGLPVTMVEAQCSGVKCFISQSIPQQCVLTDNVTALNLDLDAEKWADEILKFKDGYERISQYKNIVNKNFDISSNAKWLEEFYLERSR